MTDHGLTELAEVRRPLTDNYFPRSSVFCHRWSEV